MAVTSERVHPRIPGTTFLTAIAATPSTPQRSLRAMRSLPMRAHYARGPAARAPAGRVGSGSTSARGLGRKLAPLFVEAEVAMAQLVHERLLPLTDPGGRAYDRAYVYAEAGPVTWAAWIEFVPTDEGAVLRTGRETTQSSLEAVAYWATGLQPTYLEGALGRAWRRTAERGDGSGPLPESHSAGGAVRMRLQSVNPEVPLRAMATRTLVPGLVRQIHNGGVLRYEGARETRNGTAYDLLAQFGSENAAAVMANTLWSDLHGLGLSLWIEGEEVPVEHGAIKDALLAARTV
jgi:hypothetical protein